MAFPRQAVDLQGSGLTAGCRHWLLLSSRGELDTQRGVTRQGVAVAGVYPAKASKREAHSLGGLMGVVGVGEANFSVRHALRSLEVKLQQDLQTGAHKGCVYLRVHGWPRDRDN
jgi:hypothetical protein